MKRCTSTILCICETIFLLPKNPPLFILFCNHQRYFVIFLNGFWNIYYFLFLFIPCLFSCVFLPVLHFYTANYSFSFFGPTPSFQIPILCMFMPMFKECKSFSSISSSWHLNFYLLRCIFCACSRTNRMVLRVFSVFFFCFHTVPHALCFYYIGIREWSGKNYTSYWVSWQVG